MTDEPTLRDFLETANDSKADDGPERDRTGGSTNEPAVDPARPTYAWGTYTCSRCGSSVERVWRDGDDFVCPACKTW